MTWNHEETTLSGIPILKPGTLALVELRWHMLLDAETPVIDPDKWIKADFYISELGPNPIVIILDLDPLENYYQILLGEKKFWFPVKFTFMLE